MKLHYHRENLLGFNTTDLRPQYLLAPFTSSVYDTSPLRATLERVLDLDRLNTGRAWW
jgi:hypothetical protein